MALNINQEGLMSPEDLEGTEVVAEELEVLPEPEKPRRVDVDLDELREMRETIRRQSAELHQHKLFQMQQYQQSKAPEVQVDPDVRRVVAPVIQEAMRPYQEENERLKSQLQQNSDQLRVQANIDYIERNIPNFDEIRVELASKIEKLPKAEQDMLLSSPTLLVELGHAINATKGKSTKSEVRARAVSESGSGTSPSQAIRASGAIDWNNLSDAEFAAQDAKIEQQRRKR
jgi:hypothetical protein